MGMVASFEFTIAAQGTFFSSPMNRAVGAWQRAAGHEKAMTLVSVPTTLFETRFLVDGKYLEAVIFRGVCDPTFTAYDKIADWNDAVTRICNAVHAELGFPIATLTWDNVLFEYLKDAEAKEKKEPLSPAQFNEIVDAEVSRIREARK